MKNKVFVALCSAFCLASVALAFGQADRVGQLSPNATKEILRNLQPQLSAELRRQLGTRPEAADLMVHPIQITPQTSPMPSMAKFRLFVPLTNIGRAASVGVVVKLMRRDTSGRTGRDVLAASARLASLRPDEMGGLGMDVLIAKTSLAKHYSRVWVVITPSDLRHTRTYSDANDANNTTELSADELLARVGK
jgi:hypothetical protein